MTRRSGISATAIVLIGLCSAFAAERKSTILLTDVTSRTGITFVHTDGSSGSHYIVENVASGLALFDYDNDGDIDIYFLNGGALKGTHYETPPRNAMYRNEGHWRFTDVTEPSGLGDLGHALAVAVGDYDNDGDQDVYVTNFGPNVLFRNNGDGTFTDVTGEAGVGDGDKVGAGANFLDADGDGDLDLFSSSYIAFTYENHVERTIGGHPVYVGPRAYEPTRDTLFRNEGNGTFTDISNESGIASSRGAGMGTVCIDFDDDGDTDIYVGNDVMQNFLWQNDGTGKFEEIGLLAGVACDMNGRDMGTMGTGCGDYNNDGLLDLYATAYQDQLPSLYRNCGDGLFEDVSLITGAGAGANRTVTWGNDFVDFDYDGDRDLFVALGHLQDNIELWDRRSTYHATNELYMNTGDGKFVSVSDSSGDGLKVKLSSRGAGFDDLDGDGDVDVVVLNSRREPTLMRNDSPNLGHWLQVKLRGTKTNRDGVGARVKVFAGDLTLVDEVHSGEAYQSHYGTRLYFGLGRREKIDRVEVRWIGGAVEVFKDIKIDSFVTLVEGQSEASGS
ncbi:MAG: CRTAC1 family protein [Sedimentisphaerales bacterium]|nr:CRTAC1 family protein [Sedimentisphaerales bacterium]